MRASSVVEPRRGNVDVSESLLYLRCRPRGRVRWRKSKQSAWLKRIRQAHGHAATREFPSEAHLNRFLWWSLYKLAGDGGLEPLPY